MTFKRWHTLNIEYKGKMHWANYESFASRVLVIGCDVSSSQVVFGFLKSMEKYLSSAVYVKDTVLMIMLGITKYTKKYKMLKIFALLICLFLSFIFLSSLPLFYPFIFPYLFPSFFFYLPSFFFFHSFFLSSFPCILLANVYIFFLLCFRHCLRHWGFGGE